MDTWDICLLHWITMDWGYDDVARGDVIESPLGFSSDEMVRTDNMQKRIERTHDRSRRYHVVAEVTAVWKYQWQIDFGLRATSGNAVPEGVTRGSFVTGYVDLFFDYPTDWLGYKWSIDSITKETAPLIPSNDEEWMRRYPKSRMPDSTRTTHSEIERTDGYLDGLLQDTDTRYILHCRLIDTEDK